MPMKQQLVDDTLTIFLDGEINSYSADEYEAEIEEILDKYEPKNLIVDMKDLFYMSSAGIRIVMKLNQRFRNNLLLDNVPNAVYDVLAMVGLDKILKINRLEK